VQQQARLDVARQVDQRERAIGADARIDARQAAREHPQRRGIASGRQHDDTLRMESLGIGFPAMELFVGLD
jgi:hypothetical protein